MVVGSQAHVLVIPSWYPQFPGDPGGSFFREQAVALAKCLPRVGVLFANIRSLRELRNPGVRPVGQESFVDNGVHVVMRHTFNWTPRLSYGVAWQWLYHGVALFEEYVSRHGRPDIIHAHSALYAGCLARALSARTGIPYVVTEHSSCYFANLYSSVQLNMAGKVFAGSAENLAVSSSLLRLLVEKFGREQSWQVVPNIVEDSFFATALRTGIDPARRRVLSAGELKPNKRQRLLIEAIDYCRQAGEGTIELSIAGAGPEREALEREIAKRGLEGRVRLLGLVPRADMPALMADHDAFSLASDYETFGVVVAEALATGLPCISTDCGGPVDIIGAGDGAIVSRGDATDLARAIREMLDRACDTQERIDRRARCAARFSEQEVCKILIDVYTRVMSQCSMVP